MVSSTARQDASPASGAPQLEEVSAAAQGATTRLVESLLHDARNPLNALAIHLEVLTEKLKDDSGAVPPTLEKNLRAMREQVLKVDHVLRIFADFLIIEPNRLSEVSLGEALERALEALGHEANKRRVKVKLDLEAGLKVRLADPLALRFLAYQSLLRAVQRANPGSEVEVSLTRAGGRAVLRVQDEGGDGEPNPLSRPALEALGKERSVEVSIHGGRCELRFSVG